MVNYSVCAALLTAPCGLAAADVAGQDTPSLVTAKTKHLREAQSRQNDERRRVLWSGDFKTEKETKCETIVEGNPELCLLVCTEVTSVWAQNKLLDETAKSTHRECDPGWQNDGHGDGQDEGIKRPTYYPTSWFPTYFPTEQSGGSYDEDTSDPTLRPTLRPTPRPTPRPTLRPTPRPTPRSVEILTEIPTKAPTEEDAKSTRWSGDDHHNIASVPWSDDGHASSEEETMRPTMLPTISFLWHSDGHDHVDDWEDDGWNDYYSSGSVEDNAWEPLYKCISGSHESWSWPSWSGSAGSIASIDEHGGKSRKSGGGRNGGKGGKSGGGRGRGKGGKSRGGGGRRRGKGGKSSGRGSLRGGGDGKPDSRTLFWPPFGDWSKPTPQENARAWVDSHTSGDGDDAWAGSNVSEPFSDKDNFLGADQRSELTGPTYHSETTHHSSSSGKSGKSGRDRDEKSGGGDHGYGKGGKSGRDDRGYGKGGKSGAGSMYATKSSYVSTPSKSFSRSHGSAPTICHTPSPTAWRGSA